MDILLKEKPQSPVLSEQPPAGSVYMWWLGQAGFALAGGGMRVLIDPYLSDSLAEKYRGRKYSHQRMMPIPVEPGSITSIDVTLCTHAHTDHFDPATLGPLMQANPRMRVVVPRAVIEMAIQRGVPREILVGINAGEQVDLGQLKVSAIPAAHEDLQRNERGEYLYLGYILQLAGLTVYHSGDTVPFDGLAEAVGGFRPDVALLPVNGRDAERAANGVPGNLTFDEAVELCRSIHINLLFAHHFGLFDFNTVPRETLEDLSVTTPAPPTCVVPSIGVAYELIATGRTLEHTP